MENSLTDQQLKEKALEYDRILNRNVLESLLLLTIMYEEKLYVYLGFDSLKDYCLDRLGMAEQTMYHYLNIARKFPQILQDFAEVSHARLTILGIEKLKILTNLEPEKRLELQETGEVELNGKTYTIEDFKQMPRKELSDIFNGKQATQISDAQKEIPFLKVYNVVEKAFTKILKNVTSCSDISIPDQKEIEICLAPIAKILDRYKREEEATRKIR